ncbi:hypothetical protein TRIUR3_17908 [Triticum urartu]|uniref:Uncharacterized protein n=1 Tax=Triticum urartu TaxID=4572 RepID=M8A7X1_TRIUA|nr:hypothetical protein TRIUR3_17908 [Triticum urartu]
MDVSTFSPELGTTPLLICSFADLQSGSPKAKPLPLNESNRGNTPDRPSNFRSGTRARLSCQRRKPYLSTTNHEPNTRFTIFQMSSMQTTICIRFWTPPKLRAGYGANAAATTEPEDTALLQLTAWGTLAIMPVTGDTFPTHMICILIGNLGASVTEVVSDAVVTEFSRTQRTGVLQSYAFIGLAAGALLGNLSGGYVLLRTQEPKIMFTAFSVLLGLQLALSIGTKETLPSSHGSSRSLLVKSSLSANLRKQFSNLMTAVREERIFYPLAWIMTSFAVVPVLSGTMFCFQTQHLKLDSSIIGLSKVMGQVMVVSLTVLYNRHLKRIPLRRLVGGVQIMYAFAVLSELILVKQVNLMLGIPNEVYVLCFSALAEAIAQFKVLPFSILLSSLCPPGCEGSLFAFFTSGLVFSAILSGVFGVGLSALIGLSSGGYSSLPLGILLQSLAALLPLAWLSFVPENWTADGKIVKQR